MNVQNYTYKQFTEIKDKDELYDILFAIEFSEEFNKPVDHLGVGPITEFKFGVVKDLQELEDDSLEEVFKAAHLPIDNSRDILSLFQQRSYILEGVKQISEVERQTLSSGPMTARESNALYDEEGNNLFEGLSVVIQLATLSNNDVTKWEAIRNLPWSECYAMLLLDSRRNKFQRNLQKSNKV